MIAHQLSMVGGMVAVAEPIPPTPAAARDAAIDRVERGADDAWMAEAAEAIEGVVDTDRVVGRGFTTDDVWAYLDLWRVPSPREPRAMGAAMRLAERAGIIQPTGEYRTSRRAECHCRPVRVWRGCA